MTLKGLVSMTLLCVVQWSRNCLLLVPNFLSIRFHRCQLPQYEDVRLIRFDQSFARVVVMSLIGRHFGRQLWMSDFVSGPVRDFESSGEPIKKVSPLKEVHQFKARFNFDSSNGRISN